jgi:hypothetical protein
MAKAVKMTLPDGRTVDGIEVQVDESNERWTDITLQDGAKFRVKVSVINALRTSTERDATGQPIYTFNMTPVIVMTNLPAEMQKKTSEKKGK